jgi:hypothetical protein
MAGKSRAVCRLPYKQRDEQAATDHYEYDFRGLWEFVPRCLFLHICFPPNGNFGMFPADK